MTKVLSLVLLSTAAFALGSIPLRHPFAVPQGQTIAAKQRALRSDPPPPPPPDCPPICEGHSYKTGS